jgi:hypothetical protein
VAVAEADVAEEAALQEAQPTEALSAETAEALAQAHEGARAVGEPVSDVEAAIAGGEVPKAEIIGDIATGRVLVITAESEAMEAMRESVEATSEAEAQPESDVPAKKPVPKGKSKKGAATTDSADK